MPSLTLRHSAILIGGCLVALPAIASAGDFHSDQS